MTPPRSREAVTPPSRQAHRRQRRGNEAANGVGLGEAAMDYRILGPLEAFDDEPAVVE
jgi:hypothetical protein